MANMQSEVYNAFRAGGSDEDKAMKASAAISDAIGSRDTEIASIKTDLAVLKWMLGFVLAMQVALFVKAFIH